MLFPPATSQKGNHSKGKENQSAKVTSAAKENMIKDLDVKDVGMLWERKVKKMIIWIPDSCRLGD